MRNKRVAIYIYQKFNLIANLEELIIRKDDDNEYLRQDFQ